MTELPDGSITEALQQRQQQILSRLPSFARTTFIIAAIGFLVYSIARLIFVASFRTQVLNIELSLGTMIALLLGLFSNLVVWLFVVWSLSFIPYIAYYSHRASRGGAAIVTTRPLRWLQLYAATFLPMAVFAIAWNSIAHGDSGNYTLRIESRVDALVLFLGTALVVISIFGINRLIPVRFAAIRLSFLSTLIYLSLFLAYGQGVTMASHAMVFGILLYLMFFSAQLSELARRISLHDIDSKIADRFEQIIARHDEVQNLRDETQLTRKEHDAQTTKQKLGIEIAQANSDLGLNEQLAEMRVKKLNLTKKMNEAQLKLIENKIDYCKEVFEVLSGEMNSRVSNEIPQQIEELRRNVKDLTPEEIQSKMNQIIKRINENFQGIPDTLTELRNQLRETTSEIERQTRLIAAESDEENREPPKAKGAQV